MEHERKEKGKKPIALPVTLALLVLSLIGNVFLYSKFLQHGQDRKYDKGQEVGHAAADTASFYTAALKGIAALKESRSQEDRAAAKFELGRAYGAYADGASRFVQLGRSLKQPEANADDIYRIMAEDEQRLSSLGNHEGPLTEDELAVLDSFQNRYTAELDIIRKFNFDAAGIRSSSIRLGAGFDWPEIAEELEGAILQAGSAQ
ncbi:hypothetical protein ACFSL6_04015 [Paenibacillus thailandensis]|uniref:Uncharacterized protein n=1 Tax=Paenibacillus thailandensis TaxID=393250 RepID=A0ABW5QZP3_9BACL